MLFFWMIMQDLRQFLSAQVFDVIPIDPKTLGILVAVLFLLSSFLFNLLQRRRSKTRLDRLLENDKSVVNFLGVIDEYLGKLERSCTFELQGTRSPKEVGESIYVARNKIQSEIAAMEGHLRSYGHERRKERRKENQRKRLMRSLKKFPLARRHIVQ